MAKLSTLTPKKNPKKRPPSDENLMDMAPIAKRRKTEVLNIKSQFNSNVLLYSQNKISLDNFQQEINALWDTAEGARDNPVQFLSFFFPKGGPNVGIVKEAFNKDDFFEWVLNEIEQCAAVHQISLMQSMFQHVSSEERLSRLLKNSMTKELIFNTSFRTFVAHIVDHKNINITPLTLIKQYFSAEQFEQLKTKILIKNTKETFFDTLRSIDIESLFAFWEEGFKPYSQKQFNLSFFSGKCDTSTNYLYNAEGEFYSPNGTRQHSAKILHKLYSIIINSTQYTDWLVFPEESNHLLLFLNNSAIDKDMFAQLLEKKQLVPNVQNLMTFLRDVSPLKLNQDAIGHIIKKVIYIISSFELPLDQPANSSFLARLNNGVVRGLETTNINLIKVEGKTALLQPSTTVADEILFCSVNLARKEKAHTLIEPLYHILKAKHAQPSILWRTLLNAYLIQFLSIKGDKKVDDVNLAKSLNNLFVKFTPDTTVGEKQEAISSIVSFAVDVVMQISKIPSSTFQKQNISECIETAVDHFVAFVMTLMNPISGQIVLPQETYYDLATLLLMQIQQSAIKNSLNMTNVITNFLSYYKGSANQHEFSSQVLAQLMAILGKYSVHKRLIVDEELIALVSTIEPMWIAYASSEFTRDGKTHNVFSVLLRQWGIKDQGIAEQSARAITYLLTQLADKIEIMLPLDFLQEVADWKHNLSRKALLSDSVQELLEMIYNQCIHKVQGTVQEQIFEDMRTKLLLKYDADPSKDTQGIHARENHQFSDKIFAAWTEDFAKKPEERTSRLKQAMAAFSNYIKQEKDKKVSDLIAAMDGDESKRYIQYIYGKATPEAQKFKRVAEPINLYTKLMRYLEELRIKGNKTVPPQTHPMENRSITDARNLFDMIAMAVYYATNEDVNPPTSFALQKTPEVLNILLLELLDQVENPSCDQGPFIRLFMALELVADYKFPYFTLRSLQFYIKEYINNHYDQLTPEKKESLIASIYEKIEDTDKAKERISSIPEDALTFLMAQFMEENQERIGQTTSMDRDIQYIFFMERPEEYHPKIVEALNQLHQKRKTIATTSNPYGFFMNQRKDDGSNPMNAPDSMDFEFSKGG